MPDSLSHYSLLEKLGTGGMGTVYRAEDAATGGIVALKTLHPHLAADADYVRRFEAEARIAQSIDSPNVVKVLDYGHDGDTYFLVMEFVPGTTLADVIQQRGELPVAESVSIAAAIARALVAANAKAIVHRDISPQNVMITPEGEAKVTDFGVSRDLTQQTMTSTSMLMGKPLYIAPEVATGASKADIRADIYALGVIVFQMLAGKVPFNADTPFAVMMKHVSEPLPSLRGLRADAPPWLVDVVERCLKKEPGERFQTPDDVVSVIDDLDSHNVTIRLRSTADEPTLVGRTPAGHRDQATLLSIREAGQSSPSEARVVDPPEERHGTLATSIAIGAAAFLVTLGLIGGAILTLAPGANGDKTLASGADAPLTTTPVPEVAAPVQLQPAPLPAGSTTPPTVEVAAPAAAPPVQTNVAPPPSAVVVAPTAVPQAAAPPPRPTPIPPTPLQPLTITYTGKLANAPVGPANDRGACRGQGYSFNVPGLRSVGTVGDGTGSGHNSSTSGLMVGGDAPGQGAFTGWSRDDETLRICLANSKPAEVLTITLYVADGRRASTTFQHTP